MGSKKDLSVIIVNYKSWAVLAECLNSFRRYPPQCDYEIIVVDNDSQDGRLNSFATEFPEATIIENSGNNGFSNGCNLGADHASGEHLLFLNPDIVLTADTAIDTMLAYACKHPQVGITSCRRINPKGRPEREISFLNPWLTIGWLRALYKLFFKAKLRQQFPQDSTIWHPEWVSGSVILIHADLFMRIGRWSADLYWMYFEDPDLCKKVRTQGKEIALLRHVSVKHAHGGASRRNPRTTAITKSEVVTSCHVFIQNNEKGLNRVLLHTAVIANTLLSQTLKTILTAFWRPAFKANILTLIATIRYYVRAPIRHTWKSKRLIVNEP